MECSYKNFYKKWSTWISLINILGVLLVLNQINHILWLILVTILFGVYIERLFKYQNQLAWVIGYANWVTIIRLVIILSLFSSHPILSNWVLFGGFLLSTCLDGLDGYLARKFNQESESGGNLDMESDAFMVLALSVIHFQSGVLLWWILIPGAARYIYQLIFLLLPKNNKELMPKKYRATIAVIFFLSLLIPFLTQNKSWILITYISGATIIVSFLVSFFGSLRKISNKY